MDRTHESAVSGVFVLLLVGTLAALAVAPGHGAQASEGEPVASGTEAVATAVDRSNGTTTVSVSATGDAQAEPDLAVLRLSATATAEDPGTATERLARNVSRLRDALLAANVSSEDVRTTSFDVYEERDPRETERPTGETRYVAQQRIAVTVRNTSRVGDLVDVAVESGATGVEGVEFTLSDETRAELRAEALEKAMASARSQAETLAATEDLQITGVRSISTGGDSFEPFFARETALATEAGTTIDSGPVAVSASVQVVYNATG